MNYIPVYRVALVRESSQKVESRVVTSPANAYSILKEFMSDVDREHSVVLLLDTRNEVKGIHTVSIGSLNASIVHPRETFRAAILNCAAAIICAHNHPSGDTTPSPEDLAITNRLKEAGELLGIPLFDSLILGEDRFVSLKERGLL